MKSRYIAPMTFEQLSKLVAYDKETGILTRIDLGRPTGNPNGNGYLQMMVNGHSMLCHRAAWFLATGAWPTDQIDHINHDRSDNRWMNLRQVDQSANMQNRAGPQSNNALKILGVTPSLGRFRACIQVDGKFKHLGRFDTSDEAQAAYIAAKRQYHAGCTI